MRRWISDEEAWKRAQAMHPDFQETISDEEAARRCNLIIVQGRAECLTASSTERKQAADNNALAKLKDHFYKPRRK